MPYNPNPQNVTKKTWTDFPEFYNHPFIQSIAQHELWSISDAKKKPIDMWDFVFYNQDLHRAPKGAKTHTGDCLMTLSDVCRYVPNARNNAYYFDSNKTGCIVLDVEPTCSDELKTAFLNTNYIYGEVSMSGKGFHLIYKTPECLKKYPDAMKKTKMQDSKRQFEFLMEHWITFTRIMIPPANPGAPGIDDYFEQICALQKYTEKQFNFDVDAERPKNIPNLSVIMMVMKNDLKYKKTIDDFNGDKSRYEFGYAATLYCRLKRVLGTFKQHEYTQTEKAWILYDIMTETLEHREKHETMRDGKPWLLYLIQNVMARNDDSQENQTPGDAPVYPQD